MFLMTKNPFVFHLYTKICFRNITFQFSRSSTKHKNCCYRSSTILTAFVLLIVSRDLVFLRYLFFQPDCRNLGVSKV